MIHFVRHPHEKDEKPDGAGKPGIVRYHGNLAGYPPSVVGRRQAPHTAGFVTSLHNQDYPIERIVTSSLERAEFLAQAIQQEFYAEHGIWLPIEKIPELNESWNHYAGMTRLEWPGYVWENRKEFNKLWPVKEPPAQAANRIEPIYQSIVADGRNTVLVGHSYTQQAVMSRFERGHTRIFPGKKRKVPLASVQTLEFGSGCCLLRQQRPVVPWLRVDNEIPDDYHHEAEAALAYWDAHHGIPDSAGWHTTPPLTKRIDRGGSASNRRRGRAR